MSARTAGPFGLFTFAVIRCAVALAQHNNARTITVDPTAGAADWQTIAQALADNRIPSIPTDKYTILIYAGSYNESVTLGPTKENIDLVGVDRDSVIIAPTTPGTGVTITTGDETVRNNAVRNLTIKTNAGHGIEIVVGVNNQVPKNITIENVTIDAHHLESPYTVKYGIAAQNLQDSRIADCKITTTDGHAIDLTRTTTLTAATNNVLTGLTLLPAGSAEHGIRASDVQGLQILNSTITPDDGEGIELIKASGGAAPSNVTIDGVTILTDTDSRDAVDIASASSDVSIRNCVLDTRSTKAHALYLRSAAGAPALTNLRILGSQLFARGGTGAAGPTNTSDAIRLDHPTTDALVQSSYLQIDKTGLAVNLESNASGTLNLHLEQLTVRGLHNYPLMDFTGSTRTRLANSDLLDADAPYNFVHVGTGTEILNCSIRVDPNSVDNSDADYDSAGVYGNGASGLRICNSRIQGLQWGIRLDNNCTDVIVGNCEMITTHYGVFLECGDNILFEGCTIVGDSVNGKFETSPPEYHGVFIDDKDSTPTCEPGSIRFTGCAIRAASGEIDLDARGVYVKAAPPSSKGPVRLKDCNVTAVVSVTDTDDADEARAYGVVADEAGSIAMEGGSITSTDVDDREDIQYDVYNNSGGVAITTSGVKFSKGRGPIAATLQPVSLIQRTVNVSAVSDTAILAATALTTSEQTITSGITQPDVFRVLSVKGNLAGMNQKVNVIGTNFANERITDVLTLSGTSRVDGVKPLKSVSKIILPAQTGPGQTVSVGNSAKLGLYFPVGATSDVLQQARKATAASAYTLEGVGSVNTTHAFVDVSVTSPITAGDSFEFAYLASR